MKWLWLLKRQTYTAVGANTPSVRRLRSVASGTCLDGPDFIWHFSGSRGYLHDEMFFRVAVPRPV